MRAAVLSGLAVALFCGAAAAQACPAPVDVQLAGDAAAPPALLLLPPGWAPGDPAAVLLGGEAFRSGCADRRVSAMLEAGILVLALGTDRAPAGTAPLAGAFAVLHDGFGAGAVGALWPDVPPVHCEALLAPLAPLSTGVSRACRLARRS